MGNQKATKRNEDLFAELEKYPENSKEYRDIVAKIVKSNEPLIKYVVKRYCQMVKPTMLNSDDLMSDGYFALLKAIKAFKKEKGAAFATYAIHHIRGGIARHLIQETNHPTISLEANQERGKQSLKDYLVSPINIEEDFIKKDETERQMAWVKENLDQLTPLQKRVLISRYLSGETMTKVEVLAEELGCVPSGISEATNKAVKNLRKIYSASHPDEIKMKAEIELTNKEKIKLKEELKNLIETEFPPMRKKTMLCKFYSPTPKTNGQVAEEIGSTRPNVATYVSQSYKKLCTLCDSIKDTKHLKNILEFRTAENGKENEKEC